MKASVLLLCTAAYGQALLGTITDSVSGAPIAGVTVQIQSSGKPALVVSSDATGTFRVDTLAEGSYSVRCIKDGFDPPAQPPPSFSVRAGAEGARLRIQLVPRGKVAGRVLDASGNPVPGAQVELMRSSFNGAFLTSGKDGTFRFEVPPGIYKLDARPPQDLKPPESASGEKLGWVRTWYPGVTDASAAERITVGPGSEVWGQDVKLAAAQVYRVRGTVYHANGDPAAKQKVQATPMDEIAPRWNLETVSDSDGAYEFPDVHNGDWHISAVADTHQTILRASLGVTVAGRDLDKLALRLSAPFSVGVRMVFDPAPGKEGRVPALVLHPQGGGDAVIVQLSAGSEGRLQLDQVYPGLYRVQPISPGAPYYLASVTMGGRDIFGQYVEFNPGAQPIEVTYKSGGGAVRGNIENCGDAVIVLAPRDAALRQNELVATGRCSTGGHFEIANVRPGDYYAYAFAKVDLGAAAFLASLGDPAVLHRAAVVTVHSKEATSVELQVQ